MIKYIFFSIQILNIFVFLAMISYKGFINIKIMATREKRKYEGLFRESLKLEQIQNNMFIMIPYRHEVEEADNKTTVSLINKYNLANKIYIATFIIFVVFCIIAISIFGTEKIIVK